MTVKNVKAEHQSLSLLIPKRIAIHLTIKSFDFQEPQPTRASEKDRQVYEENRELESRIAALRNKVEMNRKILATMKIPEGVETPVVTTTQKPLKASEDLMLGGDTARALSWMINDMERMVDDKTKTEVSDQLPVEKIEEEPIGFRIGDVSFLF